MNKASTEMQPKAVRQGYGPEPFFFAQTSDEGDVRLVAWAPSLSTMRRTIEELIKAHAAPLVALGFEQRMEPLVSDEPYWGHVPAAGREQEIEFIRLLRLSPVPGPGESWEGRKLQ